MEPNRTATDTNVPGDMELLVGALEEEEFNDGECIVREGEIGHFFYIVKSGEIAVHKREDVEGGDGVEATAGGGDGAGGEEEGERDGMGPQVSTLK